MNRTRVGCVLALVSTLSIGVWGQSVSRIDVRQGTVVYVAGNDLVVKMGDDSIKHFVVPADSKFTVDGKDISLQDLTPGTKLTQTLVTTADERWVTNVRNLDAKVLEVKPPHLTIASGDTIRYLKVPEGTRFSVDGKEMVLSDLREGMRVKGTVVTAVPTIVVSSRMKVTGETPKSVDTPTLAGVLLFEETDTPDR
jgi:hypothetical protein